jgi:hypothetical protein
MKKWGPFACWVDAVGDRAVDALKRLETLQQKFSVDTFRNVRLLRTPESRMGLANWLSTEVTRVSDLEGEIGRLAKAMWVEFHWSAANPMISERKRVPPFHPHIPGSCVHMNSV